MQVEYIHYPLDLKKNHKRPPAVVAIGFFDGVHQGHQELFKQTRAWAERLQMPPGIMTFDPHPREVLGNTGPFQYVTPLAEKLRQIKKQGMAFAYVFRFDRSFAALSPRDFVEEVVIPLHIKGVVVGFNYTFGHQAAGKAKDLKRYGRERLDVKIVEPVCLDGIQVSSTRLRQALQEGDVPTATKLLGRPYRMHGIVEHGAGRGKEIGFPTANIRLTDPYVVPRTGIYAVKVGHEGNTYYGALSVGFNPTFEADRQTVSVEVYILDFSADLYGDTLHISLLHYLRSEAKFSSTEELIAQMNEDVRQTRELAKKDESVS